MIRSLPLRLPAALAVALGVAFTVILFVPRSNEYLLSDEPGGQPESPSAGSGPKLEDHVEAEVTPDGVRFRVRSDWPLDVFETVSASGAEASPYQEGSSPRTRPFDDDDPEMRTLMGRIYGVGGCAQPGQRCEPAAVLFKEGGDRLAEYLIVQYERSLEGGYPSAHTYLMYVAYTGSETGFRYIRDRLGASSRLSVQDQRTLVQALSHTGHEGAIDNALELVWTSADKGVRSSAINVLWRVPIETGRLRPDVLATLLELRTERWIQAERAVRYLAEHFDLGLDPEPGQEAD